MAADDAILRMTVSQPTTFSAAGENKTVSLAMENTGTTTLSNVAITSAQLPGLSCSAASLTAGNSLQCQATYTTTQPNVTAGNYVIEVAGTAQGVSQNINRSARFTGTFQAPTSADLVLNVTGPTGPVGPGTNIPYNFTVTNNGPDAAGPSRVTFTPSQGSVLPSVRSNLSPGVTCALTGINVTCQIAGLASGATFSGTVSYNVGALSPDDIVANVSASAQVTDPNPNNNSATITTDFVADSVDYRATLTASPSPAVAGGQITYQFRTINDGPDPGKTVGARIYPDANLVLVSITPVGGTCVTTAVIRCEANSLAAGAAVGADIVFSIPTGQTADLVTQSAVDFQVDGLIDPNVNNNTATAITPVTPFVGNATQTTLSAATYTITEGQTRDAHRERDVRQRDAQRRHRRVLRRRQFAGHRFRQQWHCDSDNHPNLCRGHLPDHRGLFGQRHVCQQPDGHRIGAHRDSGCAGRSAGDRRRWTEQLLRCWSDPHAQSEGL